jgi:predicted transcriptional regulator
MQEEVAQLLKSVRRPMTAKEVSIRLGTDLNSASRKLNQLAKYRFVRKTLIPTRVRTQIHKFYFYSWRKR